MNLNELRYNYDSFKDLYEEDMIVIYKGNIYPVYSHDTSNNNIKYTEDLLKLLSKQFPGLKDRVLDDSEHLKSAFTRHAQLDDAFWNFVDVPGILIGNVEEGADGMVLNFIGNDMDIRNSKELNAFMQTDIAKDFSGIMINDRPVDTNTLPQRNQIQNIPLANPVYHGTAERWLSLILTKGLKTDGTHSNWGVQNKGFTFMAADFATAEEYAQNAARRGASKPVVLEIDTNCIDKNNIVLDYDFVVSYSSDPENSPYNVTNNNRKAFYRGNVASNQKANGTKYNKFGYKGVVMPNAIKAVFLFDKTIFDYKRYTKEEYLNLPKYNGMVKSHIVKENIGNTIRLYHSTSYDGAFSILHDGYMDTHTYHKGECKKNVIWFSSKSGDYGAEVEFSIDVPEDEISNSYDTKFVWQNNAHLICQENISIDSYNFRINKIDGISPEEAYKNLGHNVDKFVEVMCNLSNNELSDERFVSLILKQCGIPKSAYFGEEEIEEGMNKINEVSMNDVSLKSFEIKDELNPKFWIDDKLNSRVRLKLLDIADDFLDGIAVTWVKPEDIVLTGSIANYNWSKYSDVDVHILMDYKKIYKKTEFVKDYFDSKKEVWEDTHQKLKIYGFPVEIYVEDVNAVNNSSGVYSLNSNKWIKEPNDFQDANLNSSYIKKTAAKLMTDIDNIEKKLNRTNDEHKVDVLSDKMRNVFNKLKNLRKEGLSTKQNEMSSGNIIWKVMRRSGYLEKIWDVINKSYDRINSIK